MLGPLYRRQEAPISVNARTSPSQGYGDRHDLPLRLRLKHGSAAPGDPEAAVRGRGRLAAYDVLQTGSGTAHSRVVTRCNSALTGQERGKRRRTLSLYCLI
jgi:hypothetical protein